MAWLYIAATFSLSIFPANVSADADGLLPAVETCNGIYLPALNSSGTCDSTTECTAQRNCPDAASACGFNANKCQDTMDFDCDGANDDVEYPGTDPTASSIAQTDRDGDNWVDNCDPDDDNDGVPDAQDSDDTNPNICRDLDGDTCDDCAVGSDGFGANPDFDPSNDGPDDDMDGICNAGEIIDTDGDGLDDAADSCPMGVSGWTSDTTTDIDSDGCRDSDEDTCVDPDADNFGSPSYAITGCTGTATICSGSVVLRADEEFDNCPIDANPDQSDICDAGSHICPPKPPTMLIIN